jgi:hypothetical protein
VPKTPGNLLNWTIPAGFVEWFMGMWNVGALVMLALAIVLGFLLYNRSNRKPTSFTLGTALIGYSLIYALVNRFAEAYSYPAFWHQVGFRSFQAFGLFAFGLAVGGWLIKFKTRAVNLTITALLALSLIWGLSAERLMVGSIKDRHIIWLRGAAPLQGIPDIENTDTWVYRSWLVLAEFRGDAPDRGVS